MELIQVEKTKRKEVIENILNKTVSDQEKGEILQNLELYFDEGSDLMATVENGNYTGFFIASPYSENTNTIEELLLEEFFFESSNISQTLMDTLSLSIKKLKKQYKPNKLEVIITKEIKWLGDTLASSGFICELIKLEKMLPQKKNLPDVIELVGDSIPSSKINDSLITQVLLELNGEYNTDIIETEEDLQSIMDGNWNPVMIIVSLEPKNQEIDGLINDSNQLLNWDDFEITYSI